MTTLQLTDDELFLVRNALHAFLSDFSHDEADIITRLQQLLHKVDAVREQGATAGQLNGAVR